jgi:hypothetical protein
MLIFGTVLAYISKSNLQPVDIKLGTYFVNGIPLFYVIVGSFLIGLMLSYIFLLIAKITNSLSLNVKSREIKSGKSEIVGLTNKVHELQLENEKLKKVAALSVGRMSV